MKNYLALAVIFLFGLSANGQSADPAKESGPVISWEKTTHDFGDIYQGDKVEYTYAFTNTGNEPLIITNVQVTCGCTTPKGWARDPIPPGGKSQITVAFNSTGKIGKQNKVITVVSNAVGDSNKVSFTTNVLEKKQPQ